MKKGVSPSILFLAVAVLIIGIVIFADRLNSGDTSLSEVTNCSDGACVASAPNASAPNCTNECNTSGFIQCYDNTSYIVCGNYDADLCLEWSNVILCPSGKTCSSGSCIISSLLYP